MFGYVLYKGDVTECFTLPIMIVCFSFYRWFLTRQDSKQLADMARGIGAACAKEVGRRGVDLLGKCKDCKGHYNFTDLKLLFSSLSIVKFQTFLLVPSGTSHTGRQHFTTMLCSGVFNGWPASKSLEHIFIVLTEQIKIKINTIYIIILANTQLNLILVFRYLWYAIFKV